MNNTVVRGIEEFIGKEIKLERCSNGKIPLKKCMITFLEKGSRMHFVYLDTCSDVSTSGILDIETINNNLIVKTRNSVYEFSK